MPFETDLKVVNIEITNQCNLRCRYCSRNRFGQQLEPHDMDLDTFVNVVDQFPRTALMALYLAGEPLMHPEVCGLIKTTRALGFDRVRIHTNGTLLDRSMGNRLIDSGLGSVIWSIDGQDALGYEEIRHWPFDKVKQNLADFIGQHRGKLESGVQWLVPKGMPKRLNQDLQEFEPDLDATMIEYPHSWVWGAGAIDGSADVGVRDVPCQFIAHYMVVSCRGEYLLCCCCLNGELVLGLVDDITARQVWNGPMQKIRQQHLAGD